MRSRIVIAAVTACFCAQIHASEYSLKGPPEPVTSERPVIASADLPLDKPWEQFTDADKMRMRDQYSVLADTEEPPFPQAGLKPIIDGLRVIQKRDSIEGDLFAIVIVDEQGNARSVSYPITPGTGNIAEISNILTSAKYKPAKCGGTQCAMEFPLHVDFKLIHSIVF